MIIDFESAKNRLCEKYGYRTEPAEQCGAGLYLTQKRLSISDFLDEMEGSSTDTSLSDDDRIHL